MNENLSKEDLQILIEEFQKMYDMMTPKQKQLFYQSLKMKDMLSNKEV